MNPTRVRHHHRSFCSCLLDVDLPRQAERNVVTAPRVGETFHLDLDGTTMVGRYVEVDPPHRMLIGWDRQGPDTATPTPTLIEITLAPTDDGTTVKVEFSGLSAEDGAFYPQLWAHHLDRIAAALAGGA